MSLLNRLRAVRDTSSVAYLRFLIDYGKCPDGIFAFFEGQDDSSFYMGFVRNHTPPNRSIFPYYCGGKNEVFDIYEKLNKRVDISSIKIFFVDKDYSDILNETYPEASCIYTTDYYSIENHLVDERMLQVIWEDIFHLINLHDEFTAIKNIFEKELNNFYDFAFNLTIWILHLKYTNKEIYINNINLNKICNIDNNLRFNPISIEVLIKSLETMCKQSTCDDYDKLAEYYIPILQKLPPKSFVRGKFELWFFIEFVEKIESYVKDNILNPKQKLKIKTRLSHSNALEILGPRAQLPESLKSFLETNLN